MNYEFHVDIIAMSNTENEKSRRIFTQVFNLFDSLYERICVGDAIEYTLRLYISITSRCKASKQANCAEYVEGHRKSHLWE